ncbi:hypothetical protein LSH36_436g00022 [Paralvinella palmiformis]|uniref:Uncharacterized protein n=1 Tax=Paralvinella palmiformis TaxID=53620 RepID=A0AAD9MZU1_9ANNE|nr:hypothetical protein LSH36_436g00022 [Paralvinella palmiformis]
MAMGYIPGNEMIRCNIPQDTGCGKYMEYGRQWTEDTLYVQRRISHRLIESPLDLQLGSRQTTQFQTPRLNMLNINKISPSPRKLSKLIMSWQFIMLYNFCLILSNFSSEFNKSRSFSAMRCPRE